MTGWLPGQVFCERLELLAELGRCCAGAFVAFGTASIKY
jgi:hypothetical protein